MDRQDAQIQKELKAQGNLPRHIAIIMDGNGRWANQQGEARIEGHRAAREAVRDVVGAAGELGIEVLTLYAFSEENWQRPGREVAALMGLLRECLVEEVPELDENNVRLMAIGETRKLPRVCRIALRRAIERLSKNTGLMLNLALSYGGRAEIVEAARRIAQEVEAGQLKSGAVTEALFDRYLYTADLPDPDLMIRTSGEMRVSNFLLWQCAYTELCVTPVLWPDFRRNHLYEALHSYQRRERRFGRTSSQLHSEGAVDTEVPAKGNGKLRKVDLSTA